MPGGGRSKRALGGGTLGELDLLHQASIREIHDYNATDQLPTGCTEDKLNIQTPLELTHEEIPIHMYTADGQQIPYGLHVFLESMKKQYLAMVTQMQSKEYSDSLATQIEQEQARKDQLTKRVKQLENQIDTLLQDSLGLLKARLRELGIKADNPTLFIGKAKEIVCSHNDLQKKRSGLEAEVRRLEADQEALITSKEKEILDRVLAQRSGSQENIQELRNMVKSEIQACLEGTGVHGLPISPLPKVGSDVTLTKVPGERHQQTQANAVKPEPAALPRMEVRLPLPGEEGGAGAGRPRSVNSDQQLAGIGRSKAMTAPRANDDYEDRFKKIITSELAKAGEAGRDASVVGRSRTGHSPGRGGPPPHQEREAGPPASQDPRTNFLPSRRPQPDPRSDLRIDPRAYNDPRDPRNGRPPHPLQDPRPGPHPVRPPLHPDPRFDPRSGRPLDPRLGEQVRPGRPGYPEDGGPGRGAGPQLPRDRGAVEHISSEIERCVANIY